MKKKKGFTLVELLAVIVILAVILVIAVPKIMDTIQNSKEGTLMSSVKLIASQAEKKYVENQVLGITDKIECSDVVKITDADYDYCDIKFDSDGKASVTISGKGKFDGMAVCNGTKTEAGISDNCYTDSACFAYDVHTAITTLADFDINVNKCVSFFDDEDSLASYEINTICSGGEVNGISLYSALFLSPDMIETLEGTGVIYNVEYGNPVTITGYDIDCGTDVWIPDTIEDGPVFAIGDFAFTTSGVSVNPVSNNNFNYNVVPLASANYDGLGITSIVFPKSLVQIGTYAFQNNNLKNVNFPGMLVSIGDEAFSGNQLVEVKLPSRITNIDYKAFRSNNIKSIVIPGELTVVEYGIFMSNPLENIVIESGVTTIESYAFSADDSIEKLVIPSTLTSIESYAFNDGFSQTKPVTIVNKNITTTFNWAEITEKTCQTNDDNIVCGNITITNEE